VLAPANRGRIVPCVPSGPGDAACFRQVIETTGRRLFGRPLSEQEITAYLALRTKERIGVVMGLPSVSELFDDKYYAQLPGGTLENFGRLFKNDLKVYVYPLQRHEGDELQTIHTLKVKPELQPLYNYLVGRGSFVQLDNFNPKYLPIFSRDVLKRIASGDQSWDEMVPAQVAEIIRQRGFFGYTKKD
jgi:hypothetical protein